MVLGLTEGAVYKETMTFSKWITEDSIRVPARIPVLSWLSAAVILSLYWIWISKGVPPNDK
jgi:hypothetical protein